MSEAQRARLKDRLKNKYRLVIMNDDTFEEQFSFKLTLRNLYIVLVAATILLIILGICLVAFTPLKEYLPGRENEVASRKQLIDLNIKMDSLEKALNAKSLYINSISDILSGKTPADPANKKPGSETKFQHLNLKPSKGDSALRKEIESQDKYSLGFTEEKGARKDIGSFFFYPPVKGLITASFDKKTGHFGVDVAAKENSAVKSTLDGTVIFAGWTTETGYTMQVQHTNNIVSMYKHCSALLKKTGDYVKAGDPLAIIGNSGEQTTGPHVHFELWYNGTPIDPQDYMVF